eukprot:COSAG01_NODE_8080_length_2929_cov_23.547350_4_plen_70_part_00
MLTDIYLCHACSCQEILRTETAGQVLCSLHTAVLLLLMVASEPSAAASDARVTEGHPSFERASGTMMQE